MNFALQCKIYQPTKHINGHPITYKWQYVAAAAVFFLLLCGVFSCLCLFASHDKEHHSFILFGEWVNMPRNYAICVWVCAISVNREMDGCVCVIVYKQLCTISFKFMRSRRKKEEEEEKRDLCTVQNCFVSQASQNIVPIIHIYIYKFCMRNVEQCSGFILGIEFHIEFWISSLFNNLAHISIDMLLLHFTYFFFFVV